MAIEFVALGPGDYDRAKRVLNRARHPGFVGREYYFRCATSGHAILAVEDGADLGVALVEKGKLGALSVVPEARSRGVGAALVVHARPNFVSAIEDRVGFFERLGYKRVGPAAPGKNGKLAVQLMERVGDVDAHPVRDAATGARGPAAVERTWVEADPAFMKLYLERVLGQPPQAQKIDLSEAPPEVVDYLANQAN